MRQGRGLPPLCYPPATGLKVSGPSVLAWLHFHAGEWCEKFVLSALDEDDASRDAMLAGFFLRPFVGDERLYRLLVPVMTRLATGELHSPSYSPEGVARFCIGGWLSKEDDGRWLSDDDFRMVLIRSGDMLRTHALWQVGQFKEIDEKLAFLRGVWPLQLSARTPAVVSRLIYIVLDDEAHFPAMAEAVRPLLARTDARTTHLWLLGDKNEQIIAAHPEIVLDLLSGILSDDAATGLMALPICSRELVRQGPNYRTIRVSQAQGIVGKTMKTSPLDGILLLSAGWLVSG